MTNPTQDDYDYVGNLEHDFGFSEKEMAGINRAIQQAVREARREARIDEINMALGIEELWVSPATKRQAYYEKRLKELQEDKSHE